VVPRGSTLIGGGTAQPTDTEFSMEANIGNTEYGILENQYLAKNAHTDKYTCTITINGDTWSYDELTHYTHAAGGSIAHRDRNTLKRTG
jgi:hypothetical protein